MNRLVILPDERFETFKGALDLRVHDLLKEINRESIRSLTRPELLEAIQVFQQGTGYAEASIWVIEGSHIGLSWDSSQASEEELHAITAERRESPFDHTIAAQQSQYLQFDGAGYGTWLNLEQIRGQSLSEMSVSPVLVFGRVLALLSMQNYAGDDAACRDASRSTHESDLLARLLGNDIENEIIRAILGIN